MGDMAGKFTIHVSILSLLSLNCFSQELILENRLHPDKSKMIRLDKSIMVKTFQGVEVKGELTQIDDNRLVVEGKDFLLDDIMMISGIVVRNTREKASGVGLTIGAGIVLPAALYYFLGGIAWGVPNGVFVGATVMVFDLALAYAGTNLMGILPRRFSTMNWKILPSDSASGIPVPQPVPLPLPHLSD